MKCSFLLHSPMTMEFLIPQMKSMINLCLWAYSATATVFFVSEFIDYRRTVLPVKTYQTIGVVLYSQKVAV